MQFLCNKHRLELLNQPNEAILQWEIWMSQARTLMEEHQWQQAYKFLGCSYEIGEWLIQHPSVQKAIEQPQQPDSKQTIIFDYAERLMLAGHSLAACFKQTHAFDLELTFLLNVHRYLLTLSTPKLKQHWRLNTFLAISLKSLQGFSRAHGEFKEYQHYFLETQKAFLNRPH